MTETVELTRDELIAAYRERLAEVDEPQKLSAECIGAVFYGGIEAPMDEDQEIGTLLGIKHEQGWGLFGPTVWTRVKLCRACVHKQGGNECSNPESAEWRLVIWVDEVRRNGDPVAERTDVPKGSE